MMDGKQTALDSSITTLKQRFGSQVFLHATELQTHPPSIPTSFTGLDQIIRMGGIPLNAITLLSGPTTSGKLTLAYKILANAQRQTNPSQLVVIFDLSSTIDADYLARCGIQLDSVLIVRPTSTKEMIETLIDLLTRRLVRAILLDSFSILTQNRENQRTLEAHLPQLLLFLRNSNCALMGLENGYRFTSPGNLSSVPNPVSSSAALHIYLQRVRWLMDSTQFCGYQSRAHVVQNHRGSVGQSTLLDFDFNGKTVQAREMW